MASISAGGHVQPPPPSPPGHDPRTSSIQALRMRAKEHVESITKGLQMVWRLTEDTPRARTAASRTGLVLVMAWRVSEQSFAQRHSKSGESHLSSASGISNDESEFVPWSRGKSPTVLDVTKVQEARQKKAKRSSVCVYVCVCALGSEPDWRRILFLVPTVTNGWSNVRWWRVKSKRLILRLSTIGGYIFDDYRDYQCDNWQVSMISEYVFMIETHNGLIINVNLGNWVFIWNVTESVKEIKAFLRRLFVLFVMFLI